MSYYINHPQYWPPNTPVVIFGFTAAVLCQVGNLRCHLMLSKLRKPGDGSLAIPHGFLFEYITCPNYTFEVRVTPQSKALWWNVYHLSFFPPILKDVPVGIMVVTFVTMAGKSQMLGWLFFNVATQSLMGVLFMCAGASQMISWARMRHKRLKKQFDGKNGRPLYPKKRYAVLPLLL